MSASSSIEHMKKTGKSGKYLTFGLGNEEFGLEILRVREIIGNMRTNAVPGMPHYFKGVINLRGKVIPVIDIRLKFGMAEEEHTAETCIIVVDVLSKLIGILVDRVSEVLDIVDSEIEAASEVGAELNDSFILGMAKIKGQVKILLNIERVLGDAVGEEASLEFESQQVIRSA